MECKVTPNKLAVAFVVLFGNKDAGNEFLSFAVRMMNVKTERSERTEALLPCECQREPSLPISYDSFVTIIRSAMAGPKGRSASVRDVILRFYGSNFTAPTSSSRLRSSKLLLADPGFDCDKPTVFYSHGYTELTSDKSVQTIVQAYRQNGQYNLVVVDWSNLAFGNYLTVSLTVPSVGKATGQAILKLIKKCLQVRQIHLVGHSLGSHVVAYAARYLGERGLWIPRVTGLDPAYPGFYPAIFGRPLSQSDAMFVDVIHTDGGGYGTPTRTGHADFWPNEGNAKQPGCITASVPFTSEDFCSHWRSWAFWAESVAGGEFPARRCDSYDTFLRRGCGDLPLGNMGLQATPDLRGDYYLRTATREPYTLGAAGAD